MLLCGNMNYITYLHQTWIDLDALSKTETNLRTKAAHNTVHVAPSTLVRTESNEELKLDNVH